MRVFHSLMQADSIAPRDAVRSIDRTATDVGCQCTRRCDTRGTLRDGELGALVIHGFTGTPFEVRYLADQLAGARISAVSPALAGHCTTVDEFERTTWRDWADGVERELDLLAGRVKRVALVGQSLGGLLALYVASRRRDVAAVASLAAPLWLDGIAAR